MYKYFKKAQDPISSLTHFYGILLGIFLFFTYLFLGICNKLKIASIISLLIFSISVIALYSASSFYHYTNINDRHHDLYRKIYHSMINVLIAGTYTPVWINYLELGHAIKFLIFIWSIAIIGIILKICWLNAPRILYTFLYLLMGWAVLFDFPSFMSIDKNCLFIIALGGISYTIGAIIYIIKKPNINKSWGFHEIFHLFILLGTILHALAFYIYLF